MVARQGTKKKEEAKNGGRATVPDSTPQPTHPAGPPYATVNPYTGTKEKQFPFLDAAGIDAAIEKAHRAFREWCARPAEERVAILDRAGDLMSERADELAALATREVGKLTEGSTAEVHLASSILKWYAANGTRLLQPKRIVSFGLLTQTGTARDVAVVATAYAVFSLGLAPVFTLASDPTVSTAPPCMISSSSPTRREGLRRRVPGEGRPARHEALSSALREEAPSPGAPDSNGLPRRPARPCMHRAEHEHQPRGSRPRRSERLIMPGPAVPVVRERARTGRPLVVVSDWAPQGTLPLPRVVPAA